MSEVRLIDANALKETIVDLHHRAKEYSEADEAINNIIEAICDDIDNAPTVPQVVVFAENADEKAIEDMKAELQNVIDSERLQGKWIKWDFKTCGGLGDWDYQCSVCGKVYGGEHNFCPNCGAKMKGGAE